MEVRSGYKNFRSCFLVEGSALIIEKVGVLNLLPLFCHSFFLFMHF